MKVHDKNRRSCRFSDVERRSRVTDVSDMLLCAVTECLRHGVQQPAVHHDAAVSSSHAPAVKCVVAAAAGNSTAADSIQQEDPPHTSSSRSGSSGAGLRVRLLRRLGFHQSQPTKSHDHHLSSPRCVIARLLFGSFEIIFQLE